MTHDRVDRRGLAAALVLLGLLPFGACLAEAQEPIEFDLRDHGTVSALFGPGFVITGSDDLHSWSHGLGVVGGSTQLFADPDGEFDHGEFMWIVFTSPQGVLDVSIFFAGATNGGDMLLDAYGVDGEPLVSELPVAASIAVVDISTLAGGHPIGAFRLEMLPNRGARAASLSFQPAPEPETGGAAAALAALAALGLRARRRPRS